MKTRMERIDEMMQAGQHARVLEEIERARKDGKLALKKADFYHIAALYGCGRLEEAEQEARALFQDPKVQASAELQYELALLLRMISRARDNWDAVHRWDDLAMHLREIIG